MRRLEKVMEFKEEAANAMFTKQQAIAVTMRLLDAEYHVETNSEEERTVLAKAVSRAEFRYLDATETETDKMLDSLGVARFTTADIVSALDAILFDAQS